jgi:hypothetical protein
VVGVDETLAHRAEETADVMADSATLSIADEDKVAALVLQGFAMNPVEKGRKGTKTVRRSGRERKRKVDLDFETEFAKDWETARIQLGASRRSKESQSNLTPGVSASQREDNKPAGTVHPSMTPGAQTSTHQRSNIEDLIGTNSMLDAKNLVQILSNALAQGRIGRSTPVSNQNALDRAQVACKPTRVSIARFIERHAGITELPRTNFPSPSMPLGYSQIPTQPASMAGDFYSMAGNYPRMMSKGPPGIGYHPFDGYGYPHRILEPNYPQMNAWNGFQNPSVANHVDHLLNLVSKYVDRGSTGNEVEYTHAL